MENKKLRIAIIILAIILFSLVVFIFVTPAKYGPTPGWPTCESRGGICVPVTEECEKPLQKAPEDMGFHCKKKDTICCIKLNPP